MTASNSTLFQPIFFSLREQIADRIRTDVMSGQLPEGERLNEIELGEKFGAEPNPYSRALEQLMHEGLLEGRPNAGIKVAARPADAICDFIVIIRRMVEIFALRIFFTELTESDFAHWQTILEPMRQACLVNDYKAIAKHDIDFHRSIVRRAR